MHLQAKVYDGPYIPCRVPNVINKTDCLLNTSIFNNVYENGVLIQGQVWYNEPINFDNVLIGYIALFQVPLCLICLLPFVYVLCKVVLFQLLVLINSLDVMSLWLYLDSILSGCDNTSWLFSQLMWMYREFPIKLVIKKCLISASGCH